MSNMLKVILLILSMNFSYANSNVKPSISSSCQFKIDQNLCAVLNFKNGISRKNDSEFEIQVTDKKGLVKEIENLDIVLWMVMKNGHEHGSDEVKIKASQKTHHVSNVWFLMVGEWLLKIKFYHKGKLYTTNLPVCVSKNKEVSAVGKCK